MFTGIAGVRKKGLLKKLALYLSRPDSHYPPSPGQSPEANASARFPIVEIAGLSDEQIRDEPQEFWVNTVNELREVTAPRLRRLSRKATAEQITCAFLNTHATHLLTGKFKSWLSVARLPDVISARKFDVRAVVHLIDNIFVLREVNGPEWPLTLPQLLMWRDVEQTMSEALAGQFFSKDVRSYRQRIFMMSVNHETDTFANLVRALIGPNLPARETQRVYLSYTMTSVRKAIGSGNRAEGLAMLEENLAFRRHFNERFIAFDPATIDELPLISAAEAVCPESALKSALAADDAKAIAAKAKDVVEEAAKKHAAIAALSAALAEEKPSAIEAQACAVLRMNTSEVELDCRSLKDGGQLWPLMYPDAVLSEQRLQRVRFPAEHITEVLHALMLDKASVAAGEANDRLMDIHVEERDYHLVDQSDAVIAYRPTIGGQWSSGVDREIHRAQISGRPYIVMRDVDDPPLSKIGPFATRIPAADTKIANLSDPSVRMKTFEDVERMVRERITKRIARSAEGQEPQAT